MMLSFTVTRTLEETLNRLSSRGPQRTNEESEMRELRGFPLPQPLGRAEDNSPALLAGPHTAHLFNRYLLSTYCVQG